MRPLLAVALALALTALLITAAGKNPLLAYAALARGALGSWDRVGVGLNKLDTIRAHRRRRGAVFSGQSD